MEEELWSEDPDRNVRFETESGRKATEEWLGFDWPSGKLAARAQILGQGTENEAIDPTHQLNLRRNGMEIRNGGFVRQKGREINAEDKKEGR